MDLNARVDVNCGRTDGRTAGLGLPDGRMKNRTPLSHLATAWRQKMEKKRNEDSVCLPNNVNRSTSHASYTAILCFQRVLLRNLFTRNLYSELL